MASARKHLTKSQRLDVHAAAGGCCYLCGQVINLAREKFEVEHVIPLALGGPDDVNNMRPAHKDCHATKTKTDVKKISKAKRVSAKHQGTYRPSKSIVPGSKRSPYKKGLDGSVTLRSTGEVIRPGRGHRD